MFDHMVWDKITISCDGWTNRNGRPQMNMLHISRHGELAHRHVDGSNETKSAVWIAEHIMKDIEERGPPNVLQFVADNASVNPTRFATNVIMLDKAWTLSSSLRRMVISDRWISWANDPQRPPQTRTDAREAKETILDERFWDKVHDIVMMMEKIFVLLR
ncbi:hypothetical protein R1sor_021507 [Riccia sorocarpa]|uniref:DUF659 domain-containing protein n=1 Tax=Riccia sorocarpa TaxID=122646 RepID=A0ABD3GKZ7_9MARC